MRSESFLEHSHSQSFEACLSGVCEVSDACVVCIIMATNPRVTVTRVRVHGCTCSRAYSVDILQQKNNFGKMVKQASPLTLRLHSNQIKSHHLTSGNIS